MKSQLFPEKQKTAQISTERWVRILPDTGEGYRLYDPMREHYLGCILFDQNQNWIYDGELLSVPEQEEIAGAITGHQKEMEQLLSSLTPGVNSQ